MKALLSLCICAITLSIGTSAQPPESFDIATFRAPAGWKKQEKPGAVVYTTSDESKGSYALITLFVSGESVGNARQDFESDWQEFVLKQFKVSTRPEIEPEKTSAGWTIITGGAAFQNDLGPAAVLMSTYSGNGRKFSISAMFNSQDNLPAIQAFAASIQLKKPAPNAQPSKGDDNTSVVGTWGISSSAQNNYAINHGIAGTITRQYTFYENGTYQFVVKNFQYTMANLLFKKETGMYQLTGSSLTIIPQKGYIQAWTKGTVIDSTGKPATTDKWGKLVSTQSTKLEKVTYQISKQYFSGIQEWQLVMQSSQPNERDGPFTGSSSFPNSWIYGTPCEKCLIEQPR